MKSPLPFDSGSQVSLPAGGVVLEGDLHIPSAAEGIVVFVHGSGSSRHSPRNQFVARVIQQAGIGTLLFDLLTKEEEAEDNVTRALRFDIRLLTRRLIDVARKLQARPDTSPLRLGFFGASTGAAAALAAAAVLGDAVSAVVSRGGRPDLAGDALARVVSPTLLIVGEHDDVVIDLNRSALVRLRCAKEMRIVPGATHLFEEPGALTQVAELAARWFRDHLATDAEEGGSR